MYNIIISEPYLRAQGIGTGPSWLLKGPLSPVQIIKEKWYYYYEFAAINNVCILQILNNIFWALTASRAMKYFVTVLLIRIKIYSVEMWDVVMCIQRIIRGFDISDFPNLYYITFSRQLEFRHHYGRPFRSCYLPPISCNLKVYCTNIILCTDCIFS